MRNATTLPERRKEPNFKLILPLLGHKITGPLRWTAQGILV